MKNLVNILSNKAKNVLFIGILSALTVTNLSCDRDDEGSTPLVELSSAVSESVITVPFFVENEMNEMPSQESDLLYEFRQKNPVVDMDGKHMTWADFGTVKGKAKVTSTQGGFMVDLELSGLIPNGVYTIWNVTFFEEGMDPSKEMLNIRGLGCIGATNGTENYFTASEDGKGSISAFTATPAPLSMMGDILADPIKDEVEFHVVGAYHLDGQTWGANLGPDGTAVEQFGFIFKR